MGHLFSAPENVKALVLGGTGLVGQYLLPRLVAAGHSVDLITRRPALVSLSGVTVIPGDLTNPDWIAAPALRLSQYAVVYHLAYGHDPDEARNRPVTVDSVRAITSRLLTLQDGATRHLVYVGSMVVFGALPAESTVSERSARVADTPYARQKLEATSAALEPGAGYVASVLHPTGVYDERSTRIRQYRDLLTHNYMPMRAGGRGINNIVHADDVAAALVGCLGRVSDLPVQNEEYIITGEAITYGEWFDLLASTVRNETWIRLPRAARHITRGPVRRFLNRAGVCCPIPAPRYKLDAWELPATFISEKAKMDFGYVARRSPFRVVCHQIRSGAFP